MDVTSWLKSGSFINGDWHQSPATFEVLNPVDNTIITQIADGNATQATQAIVAAHASLAQWSATSAQQRTDIMRRWFELIINHQHELATLLTLEQGKSFTEAQTEIRYGASFIEWFAEEGKRVYGDTIPAPSADKRIVVIKQPVGVVAAITPWNFPNAMIARKAAAALAAGCTFVVRPSEFTPLSALALAELAKQAGIPAGVFNVVVGLDAKAIGQVLTTHPLVAKFTFTGSTAVGKLLIGQCASTVKKVSMELGGNAPFIVFDDADIDAAVSGAIQSKYRNAGQTCVCTNRIFVQQAVIKQFTDKFIEQVKTLKVGNGLAENTDVGPLINSAAVAKVQHLVDQAIESGANLAYRNDALSTGNFIAPTVLTNVSNTMSIAQTEVFGPVSSIIPFTTEAEAIALANDTEAGLAAYFYSRDIGRVWRVAEQLAYGMVGINEGLISNASAPFGGVKQSGNGREGSKYGLDDYLEVKYLCFGGL